MKKSLLITMTTFLLINSTHVDAQEYSSNEYKRYACAEYLSEAMSWAETQRRIDRAISREDKSFWRAYKKLVNRCKSYDNNTIKTIENDYVRVYQEYWD